MPCPYCAANPVGHSLVLTCARAAARLARRGSQHDNVITPFVLNGHTAPASARDGG